MKGEGALNYVIAWSHFNFAGFFGQNCILWHWAKTMDFVAF